MPTCSTPAVANSQPQYWTPFPFLTKSSVTVLSQSVSSLPHAAGPSHEHPIFPFNLILLGVDDDDVTLVLLYIAVIQLSKHRETSKNQMTHHLHQASLVNQNQVLSERTVVSMSMKIMVVMKMTTSIVMIEMCMTLLA